MQRRVFGVPAPVQEVLRVLRAVQGAAVSTATLRLRPAEHLISAAVSGYDDGDCGPCGHMKMLTMMMLFDYQLHYRLIDSLIGRLVD